MTMEYLVFMHGDATGPEPENWEDYIGGLVAEGIFCGGSSLTGATCLRLSGDPRPASDMIGFIRLKCHDLDHAREIFSRTPAYLAGATIEICQLVEDT